MEKREIKLSLIKKNISSNQLYSNLFINRYFHEIFAKNAWKRISVISTRHFAWILHWLTQIVNWFHGKITLQNSGWRWPIVGKAIALRIRSGTLVGPGPIIVFSGMEKGADKTLGASTVREDMLKREMCINFDLTPNAAILKKNTTHIHQIQV